MIEFKYTDRRVLLEKIDSGSTQIRIDSAIGMPSSGKVIINSETIRYSSIQYVGGSVFLNIFSRGYKSQVTYHDILSEIIVEIESLDTIDGQFGVVVNMGGYENANRYFLSIDGNPVAMSTVVNYNRMFSGYCTVTMNVSISNTKNHDIRFDMIKQDELGNVENIGSHTETVSVSFNPSSYLVLAGHENGVDVSDGTIPSAPTIVRTGSTNKISFDTSASPAKHRQFLWFGYRTNERVSRIEFQHDGTTEEIAHRPDKLYCDFLSDGIKSISTTIYTKDSMGVDVLHLEDTINLDIELSDNYNIDQFKIERKMVDGPAEGHPIIYSFLDWADASLFSEFPPTLFDELFDETLVYSYRIKWRSRLYTAIDGPGWIETEWSPFSAAV